MTNAMMKIILSTVYPAVITLFNIVNFFQTEQACACHPEPQLTCVCISQTKLKKNILITLCNAKYVKCKPRIPMNGLQHFFSMRIGWISMRIWRWVIQSLLFRFYILGTPKTLLICHKTQK